MPLVWTTDKIITVNDVKYRLKTPIPINLHIVSNDDIEMTIGNEYPYYLSYYNTNDDDVIKIFKEYPYDEFLLKHLEAIPTVEEICIRVGCDKQGETYFICNKGKSKFPICFEHYDELTELVSKL